MNKIFLTGICGKPPRPKITKTALGAEKTVPWEYYSQTWRLIEKLKSKGISIISLEQSPKSILYTKFKPKFPLALVIGNEIKGVSQGVLKRSDQIVYLPMFGKKESLNVSVAFGIIGYWINLSRLKLKS